jgi:hypothetical protein
MTQNISFRISVVWASWEYVMQMCLPPFSSTIIYLKTKYDIKAVIASFLCKLQQNVAQLQHFPIYTTKRVVLRFY